MGRRVMPPPPCSSTWLCVFLTACYHCTCQSPLYLATLFFYSGLAPTYHHNKRYGNTVLPAAMSPSPPQLHDRPPFCPPANQHLPPYSWHANMRRINELTKLRYNVVGRTWRLYDVKHEPFSRCCYAFSPAPGEQTFLDCQGTLHASSAYRLVRVSYGSSVTRPGRRGEYLLW